MKKILGYGIWALVSVAAAFFLGGIAIGPFSPGLQLVSNLNHIQLLAQFGLVFLMFAIGLYPAVLTNLMTSIGQTGLYR